MATSPKRPGPRKPGSGVRQALTDADKRVIQDLWVKGLRQRAIADRLGLSQSTISLICRSFRKP
jgi:transposase